MSNDRLDKETSVSVDLSATGIKANAKSRAIAAVDRLMGNFVDAVNLPLERRNERVRAIMEGEKKLLEAIAAEAVEYMKVNADVAQRAIQNHFGEIFRKQSNKDAVAIEAIEQLKIGPPPNPEIGPAQLDDEFLVRLEQYSAGANTEELRAKWGRVLASEVRKPGTFSMKAMRVVDELAPRTARIFEDLCRSRLDESLPRAIIGDLGFDEKADLIEAGLVIDPGATGQCRIFFEASFDNRKLWLLGFERFAIAFPYEANYQNSSSKILIMHEGKPVLPVYLLTSVGKAISTILPDQQEQTFGRLADLLHSKLPRIEFYKLARNSPHENYHLTQILK